jgi:cell division protein FtsI (penicillin-binding protein 3)
VAAHVLGGVQAGTEDVHFAEVVGIAGAERFFDAALRETSGDGQPLRLSIDLPVQAALTEVLRAGVARFNAIGGTAVLMDARTGAVRAMVSLPDFDPNNRPVPTDPEVMRSLPLMNRAAEGVFEMGSTFKNLYAALAIEKGLVDADTMLDAKGPLFWGRHRIRDSFRMPPVMSVADAMAKSSNVVTARLAIMLGTPAVRQFFDEIGFTEPTAIEIAEGQLGRPLLPQRWADISTITISYGYGLAVTQLHMAAAYAAMVTGYRVEPTLRPDPTPPDEDARIFSPHTVAAMRRILRHTVTWGTARGAEAPGYEVGAKTGTAEKAAPGGGYLRDKTRTNIVTVFPVNDPAYVLAVSLDEPEDRTGPQPRRTAGATAAPVAGEAIARIAPLLGLRPALPLPETGVTIASNRP